MNSPHNTLEELALYAMQSLSAEESAPIEMHLQTCTACGTVFGQVSLFLALMGVVVQERPLPFGARERLMDRVAVSASVKRQDTPPGGLKNRDDLSGRVRIVEISSERGTGAATNSTIKKNLY